MPEIRDALSELRRLGMHLDPAAAAGAERERRVVMNSRMYPLYRAIGFQVLLFLALLHNLAVFGSAGGAGFLLFVAAVEVYVAGAWLALRRWYEALPPVAGWDLSDIFFLTDLLFWAAAIAVTGADRSWLFLVPLLRVADHRAAPRAFVFAWAAPLTYLLVLVWAAAQPGRSVDWGTEAVKLAALGTAAFYIALSGRHIRRLHEERAAALRLAGEFVATVRERTERLDQANRARGDLMTRIRTGLGTPLVEIVGFSQSLLRSSAQRGASEHDYVQRIHQQARWVLRILDDLAELPDLTAAWPRVSLSGILQDATAREAAADAGEAGRRQPAGLDLPDGDTEVRADPRQLTALLTHLLSAARHFGGAAPTAALLLDPATGLPETIEIMAASPRLAIAGAGRGAVSSDLLNPFSAAASGDHQEIGARFELSLARSLAEILGYRLRIEREPRLRLTVSLR